MKAVRVSKKSAINLVASILLSFSMNTYAVTECNKRISNYFVGTSEIDQDVAHLWVNFEGGGSASVSSRGAGYDSMLSSVIAAMMSKKTVTVRYFADNADCQAHNNGWVGLWVYDNP